MIAFDLSRDEFRERYFERGAWLARSVLRGAPFGWPELDAALHSIEPVPPLFQMFSGGQPVTEERYTRVASGFGAPQRRLDKPRFLEQLRAGATLVVNGFEDHSLAAARLAHDVSRFAEARTRGNAYLSFGGRGTFGRHWDTHDVFAIQLIGRKRWQVFAPTFDLPLPMHRSEASGHACPATPVLDCVLAAGDLLYVPRGWWHHAIPFDEPSLHFSVGTYAPSVQDYLLWVCANRLPETLAARQSFGVATDELELDAALAALRAAALAPEGRAAFAAGVASSLRRSEPETELLLGSDSSALRDDAVVSLNTAGVDLERGAIAVEGGRLQLHPLSRSIVAALADAPLPVAALCARLERERPDDVRAALRDLARHDVVAVAR